MSTLKTISVAVLAASLSTAAFADAGVKAGAGVSAGVGVGGVSAGVSGSAGADANAPMKSASPGASGSAQAGTGPGRCAGAGVENYGQIVSAFQSGSENPSDWATEIGALSADATVNIVTLSELKGEAAENASALDSFIADAGTDVEATRSAIKANSDLTAALEAQNYTPDDVVAVMVNGDSEATLIVDDRS